MFTNRTSRTNRPAHHIVRNVFVALFAFLVLAGAAAAGPIVKIKIGSPSKGCRGFGFCGISVEWPLTAENLSTAHGTFDGHSIRLSFDEAMAEAGNVLSIDEPIHLDAATSDALGGNGRTLTVLPGKYAVDYSRNPFGEVNVDAATRGIIIRVDPGRRSRGCTGFGICGITIGLELSRGVEASATLSGTALHIDFEKPFGQPGQALVIDEAIELDSATASSFGMNGLTVKPGSYVVDYSKNPNGSVDLPVQMAGIVINVRIGRPSRNCRGFGICSITIERDAASTEALAWLDGNKLNLKFLSPLPEQGDDLVVEEDMTLDPAIVRSLNAKNQGDPIHGVDVKLGAYRVTRDPQGGTSVQLDVVRTGIIINVRIGRPSRDCRGFGICSITIERDAAGVDALARLDGNKLNLKFLSPLPEQGEDLVIEEDIALDSATMRSLRDPNQGESVHGVVVKRGTYRVAHDSQGGTSVQLDVVRAGIIIKVRFGLASLDCRGFGICRITIERDAAGMDALARLDGNKLNLQFLSAIPDQGQDLVIEEDITLDPATVRSLGDPNQGDPVPGVVVKRGAYRVAHDSQGGSSVQLDVVRTGITVEIVFGRPKYNCRGFGICRVTIGLDNDEHSVQALVTPGKGTLEIGLADSASESGEILHIDEAITLDSAAAAALGVTTILPGEYPVDYSTNPHGTVRVFTRNEAVAGVGGTTAAAGATVHPNPASGMATVRFDLVTAGTVNLTLSDSRGIVVATPAHDEYMEAGQQLVALDASKLPSGVYFFTLRTAQGTQTGRVVVTK